MKNIHLVLTNKPSALYIDKGFWYFNKNFNKIPLLRINLNIYITNDEVIKEGYVLHLPTNRILEVGVITESNGSKSFREKEYYINGIEVLICDCKKIILTTDQDLINDGIQAIDDEFLEWFVKNPSCEEVKVEDYGNLYNFRYLILIPKEEPKQATTGKQFYESADKVITIKKQETLEEIAKSEAFEFKVDYKPFETDLDYREYAEYGFEKGFIAGVKLQAERRYSEEEVLQLLTNRSFDLKIKKDTRTTKEWFEQFKKK